MELDSLKYYSEPPAAPIPSSRPLIDDFLDPDTSSFRGANLRLVFFLMGTLMAFFGIAYTLNRAVPELRLALNYRETPGVVSLSELAARRPKDNNRVRLHSFAVPRCVVPSCPCEVPAVIPLVAPGHEKANDSRNIQAVLITPKAWSREDFDQFVACKTTVDGVVQGRWHSPMGSFWALAIGGILDLQTATRHVVVSLTVGTLGLTLMLFSCARASESLRKTQLVYVARVFAFLIHELEVLLTPTGLAALTLAGGTLMFWIGTETFCARLYDLSDKSHWARYATPLLTCGGAILLFGLVRTLRSVCSTSAGVTKGQRGTGALIDRNPRA